MKRNFILGLVFVGIFAFVAVLSAQAPSRAIQTPSGPNQRYQIVMNPNMRADTFLLDTQTGRIWEKVVYENKPDEPHVWAIMPRQDNDVDRIVWEKSHPDKPKDVPK